MKFSLFYKDYDFKVSWSAIRAFKAETGRGLWSTLQGVLRVARENSDGSAWNQLEAIGRHVDEVDGSILLWLLAKECNSTLQLSEINDAVMNSGWKPVSEDSEFAQPYTYVLYKMVLAIDKQYEDEAIKAKKADIEVNDLWLVWG